MPFYVPAVLLCLVLALIYPYYQYYIDPDGTAYLTIAARYASGATMEAINGYWSPWGCWLTAALVKIGLSPVPASVIVNAAGAVGFLFISQSLFRFFSVPRQWQWYFGSALAVFLCYAVYWQSFDDIWECFFLLAILRLFIDQNFAVSKGLWVLAGMVGALAYLAKAYAFPFVILNTLVCGWFITKGNWKQWLGLTTIVIVTMVVCSLPWIYALHAKYSIWTTSTAGSLNMSWYLVGHPYYKEGLGLLLPPAGSHSPYYWEDPYLVNGQTPHFWSSMHLLGLQVLRLGLNFLRFLKSIFQLSAFLPFIVFAVLYGFRRGKSAWYLQGQLSIVVVSFLLFPLGYSLINFEPRYLWYWLPLSMILGAIILQGPIKAVVSPSVQKYLPFIFALSYVVVPVKGLMELRDEGKEEFRMAGVLKAKGITGTFTARVHPGRETQQMARIAYFSNNSYYYCSRDNAPDEEILKEMRRYKVKYFVSRSTAPIVFKDEAGNPFPEIDLGAGNPIHMFIVNP